MIVLSIVEKIKSKFELNPASFFTEHDIHSELYHILVEELKHSDIDKIKTRDGIPITLVHHEYPTPFRCDMSDGGFKIPEKGDDDRAESGGKFKRGHYDLVVLNPNFVSSYDYEAVTGKNYQVVKQIRDKISCPAIDLAIEVVFFHSITKIPESAIDIVNQDYMKLNESLSYPYDSKTKFCKEGLMLVFTSRNSIENQKLESRLNEIALERIPLFLIKGSTY